ncbi:MAG: SusC/RagA family TonB-linked outer membrane protein, partial [Salinivirgaceae bacterium]|nr:SusC/RagA family TonB-linked outer membrane protein [Salinivirgaceae bacterium]
FAQMHNEMLANGGLSGNPDFANPTSMGTGTIWLNELFRVAPMQNISLSYRGGNEKTNIYVSGNVLNQDGIIINTGFKRYLVQFNTDTKINEKLKFGNNIKLENDIKTKGDYSIRNAMLALPTQPVFREDGTFSGTIQQPLYDGDIVNPIGKAKIVETNTKGYNAHGSIFAEYDILEGIKFKSNAGIEANFWYGRTWAPKYQWDSQTQEISYLFQSSNQSITWLWDNTLTFDKVFGLHRMNAVIGTSAQENHFEYMSGSKQQFASDLTQQLDNGTLQPTINGNGSEWAIMSYIGRVNYVYNDKYYATATLRRDGSTKFGSNKKWGTFPSLSIAWRISNEPFFRNINYINDLKLRAGFGLTGNQQIGEYTFASVLKTYKYNFNGNYVSAVVPNKMPNPNVHWEAQEQYNIGFDASFLQNRISLIFDGYIKNTTDMLVPMAVPITTGYSDIDVPFINAGKIQNKGIEVTLSTTNIDRDLKWSTDFTMSVNANKVISINDTIPMSTGSIGLNYNLALFEAGQPINVFYGFVTDGIFQTQEDVDRHAVQVSGNVPSSRTSPGDIRFKDLNNDGVINDNDRTYLGNPNPKLIFSLNNTFTYKGFDLGIYLQGVWGNKVFNANRLYTEAMAVTHNQTKETLHRWTGEGTSNEMPRAVYNDPNNNTRQSDRYIEDGSYLRIKNISLGYAIPQNIAQKVKLATARIYVSGQNLLTLTKYKGFDPEVSVNGIDNNVYPITRTISFGINLSF